MSDDPAVRQTALRILQMMNEGRENYWRRTAWTGDLTNQNKVLQRLAMRLSYSHHRSMESEGLRSQPFDDGMAVRRPKLEPPLFSQPASLVAESPSFFLHLSCFIR